MAMARWFCIALAVLGLLLILEDIVLLTNLVQRHGDWLGYGRAALWGGIAAVAVGVGGLVAVEVVDRVTRGGKP